MVKPAHDILAAIDQAKPGASRASLSRWMRQNHDELLARIGERPDWTVLAEVFAKGGLTDRTGKPASPQTARAAWHRVHKAVEASRKRAGGGAAAEPSQTTAQPAVQQVTTAQGQPRDPDNPFGFKTIGTKPEPKTPREEK